MDNVSSDSPSISSRAALVTFCCGLYLCGLTLADPDLWGHTLYGLRALERGVLLERTDPFSFTVPGATWINHEWLTELEYGWLWREFGNDGLWWWRNVVVAALLWTAWREGRRQGATDAGFVAVVVPVSICLSQFTCFVRPQLVTYLCFAATLVVLRSCFESPSRTRKLFFLPPLMIIWTNHHGGFLAGLGLILVAGLGLAVHAARGRARRVDVATFAGVAFASGLATFVTPYGSDLHGMLWYHLASAQIVSEWRPVWSGDVAAAYAIPFVLPVVAYAGARCRPTLFDGLVFAVVGLQAAMHLKHVALLGVTCLVLLPAPMSVAVRQTFPALCEQWSRAGTRWLAWAATMVTVAILVGLQLQSTLPMLESGIRPWDVAVSSRGDAPGVPLRAVSFIEESEIQGNVLTEYGWAQFAIWKLHPDSRIAFDGRYRTVYPPRLERDYVSFVALRPTERGPTRLIDGYETDVILVSTARRNVVEYLEQRPDWVSVYADEQATLFVPRTRVAKLNPTLRVREVGKWAVFPGEAAAVNPVGNTGVSRR